MNAGVLGRVGAEASKVADAPDTNVTLSDGSVVTVLECRVRHVGPVAKFIQTALDILEIKDLSDLSSIDLGKPDTFMKLISDGSYQLFVVSALLSDMDYDEFEDLPLDDAAKVIATIWQVNRDFFMQRVIPAAGSLFVSPEISQSSKNSPATKGMKESNS